MGLLSAPALDWMRAACKDDMARFSLEDQISDLYMYSLLAQSVRAYKDVRAVFIKKLQELNVPNIEPLIFYVPINPHPFRSS